MVDQRWDKGQWVLVFDRPGVHWSVILYWSELPIFLFDEEE